MFSSIYFYTQLFLRCLKFFLHSHYHGCVLCVSSFLSLPFSSRYFASVPLFLYYVISPISAISINHLNLRHREITCLRQRRLEPFSCNYWIIMYTFIISAVPFNTLLKLIYIHLRGFPSIIFLFIYIMYMFFFNCKIYTFMIRIRLFLKDFPIIDVRLYGSCQMSR